MELAPGSGARVSAYVRAKRSGPWVCRKCERAFEQRAELRIHLYAHHHEPKKNRP